MCTPHLLDGNSPLISCTIIFDIQMKCLCITHLLDGFDCVWWVLAAAVSVSPGPPTPAPHLLHRPHTIDITTQDTWRWRVYQSSKGAFRQVDTRMNVTISGVPEASRHRGAAARAAGTRSPSGPSTRK